MASFGITGISSAQASTILSIDSQALLVGESSTMAVTIECAVDWCSAYDISIRYDASLVRLDSLELGEYLGSLSRAEVIAPIQTIDPDGTVRVSAAALGSVASSANNVLFKLNVTALSAGSTVFYPTNYVISDAVGNPIPVTARSGRIDIFSPVTATATPTYTSTQRATPTSTPVPTATRTRPPQPCLVSTTQRNIGIYVGPAFGRSVRGSMTRNTTYLVTGYAFDEHNNVWWRIRPSGVTTELDRYWVLRTSVDERGDCEGVPLVEGSQVIAARPVTTSTQPVTVSAIIEPSQFSGSVMYIPITGDYDGYTLHVSAAGSVTAIFSTDSVGSSDCSIYWNIQEWDNVNSRFIPNRLISYAYNLDASIVRTNFWIEAGWYRLIVVPRGTSQTCAVNYTLSIQ